MSQQHIDPLTLRLCDTRWTISNSSPSDAATPLAVFTAGSPANLSPTLVDAAGAATVRRVTECGSAGESARWKRRDERGTPRDDSGER